MVHALADAGFRGTIDAVEPLADFVDIAVNAAEDGGWFVTAAGHVAPAPLTSHGARRAKARTAGVW